jgi:pimeloyl-ACP methyl ester carboxylesterase
MMPEPQVFTHDGLRFGYYEAGRAGPRPTLVLCHGFPELAYSWRHQLTGLAARGFHVLAPDQRGYGLSDAPAEVEAYDIAALTGDLVALLDHKRIEKAVFVGHDWGGIVVWRMPILYPDRVAGVVALNTPFMKRPPVDPITILRARFGESNYIVFFQTPDAPERAFEADLEKTFRFFMRRSDVTPETFAARAPQMRNLAFQDALAHFDPASVDNPLLTPEELAFYVSAFARNGFRGPINWYRNFTRNWERSADEADYVPHPALMIMAENDVVLPPSLTEGMEAYVPNLSKALVRNCGHWTQQEKPEEVNKIIADWMEHTF